jgi:hypothetical protein
VNALARQICRTAALVRRPQWRRGPGGGEHCVLTWLCTALDGGAARLSELAGLEEGWVTCPDCPRSFNGEARLLIHLNDDHGWTWWDFAERPLDRGAA